MTDYVTISKKLYNDLFSAWLDDVEKRSPDPERPKPVEVTRAEVDRFITLDAQERKITYLQALEDARSKYPSVFKTLFSGGANG